MRLQHPPRTVILDRSSRARSARGTSLAASGFRGGTSHDYDNVGPAHRRHARRHRTRSHRTRRGHAEQRPGRCPRSEGERHRDHGRRDGLHEHAGARRLHPREPEHQHRQRRRLLRSSSRPVSPASPSVAPAARPAASGARRYCPAAPAANCSKILLVYPASFPLSKSFLHPGQSMVASILFTTGNKAGNLPFSFIGIGNGVFTANSTPTITVVNGDAADYLVTGDATVTAGAAGPLRLPHAEHRQPGRPLRRRRRDVHPRRHADDIVSPPSKLQADLRRN